ncbi:MAG: hypothetical protein U1E52_00645 [Geminicoccaceae bacterium]
MRLPLGLWLLLLGLAGCTPYYDRLADHEQRTLERARAAKTAGDAAGACAELGDAVAGDVHPSLLIARARCLMDPAAGTPDLAQARALLERAYALPSPRRGRAALWLGQLERQNGAPAAAQIAWLERARELGEPGTERLLVKAWALEPQTYRAELLAAYRRTAATDPYSALELARLEAADPAAARAAVRALEIGARAGNGAQARTLAWLYRSGELVSPDQDRARDWLTVAAREGDGTAQRKLAEQAMAAGDMEAARRWLERAVVARDAPAAVTLSRGLLAGRYTAIDSEAAAALARLAGPTAGPDLAFAYGSLLLAGGPVARDPVAGLALLDRAATNGLPAAQAELGRRLLRGQEAPRDPERGISLLDAAAAAGDASAMFHLGRAYLDGGGGVPRDQTLGMNWLHRAAAAGSRGARLELARRAADPVGAAEQPTARG